MLVRTLGGWRSDLAVKRHRGFQRHQRNAVTNVAGESLVQPSSFRFQPADFHMMPAARNFSKPCPLTFGIGIGHGSHHATNASGDQSVGARRRASLMRVRFEIDVERSAASFVAGVLEGEHLSVLHAVVGVDAGANDRAAAGRRSLRRRRDWARPSRCPGAQGPARGAGIVRQWNGLARSNVAFTDRARRKRAIGFFTQSRPQPLRRSDPWVHAAPEPSVGVWIVRELRGLLPSRRRMESSIA